ncbi:MAG: hypothetical protein ACOZBZ_02135 [Patescibacteria group bacterium]
MSWLKEAIERSLEMQRDAERFAKKMNAVRSRAGQIITGPDEYVEMEEELRQRHQEILRPFGFEALLNEVQKEIWRKGKVMYDPYTLDWFAYDQRGEWDVATIGLVYEYKCAYYPGSGGGEPSGFWHLVEAKEILSISLVSLLKYGEI